MHEARRWSRIAPAIAAAALVAGAVVATPGSAWADSTPAPTPAASATAGPLTDGTVSVQVAPASNGIVTPGAPYTVLVQVTNGTSSTLAAGAVEVEIDRTRLADDTAYSTWMGTPADPSTSADVGSVPIGSATMPAVPAGTSHVTTVTIDPTAFGLTEWGSYGILGDVTVAGDVKARTRSAIVWNQAGAPTADAVAVVAPITVPEITTGLIPKDALTGYTATDGLLTQELDAYADRPVTLAIDPRIIASIRALGTSAPATATAWLTRLGGVSNETFALQYGDADLSGQSQAGLPAAMAPTSFAWALDPNDFPSGVVPTVDQLLAWNYTMEGVAWPRDGTATWADFAFYQASGLGIPLIGSGQLTDGGGGEFAGSSAIIGDSAFVVSDRTASDAAQAAVADTDDVTRGQGLAELSASLAIDAQRSATTGAKGTVIVLDRSGTQPVSSDRLFAALEQAPWAGTSSFGGLVSTLRSSTSTSTSAATFADSPESSERIDQITVMLSRLPDLDRFATIVSDPLLVTGRARAAALSVLANSWATSPDAFAAAAKSYSDSVSTTLDAVQIVEGSSVTVVANQSELPITLANDLPYPVNVVIHAVPSNGRLVVGQTDTPVTLEANSRKSVKIPLKAQVANGQVLLKMQLQAPDGTILSVSPPRQVTVSADWETAGMAIAGGLVVVLFGIGIAREIIKRRRRRRSAAESESVA